jgi:hypothetical protein
MDQINIISAQTKLPQKRESKIGESLARQNTEIVILFTVVEQIRSIKIRWE